MTGLIVAQLMQATISKLLLRYLVHPVELIHLLKALLSVVPQVERLSTIPPMVARPRALPQSIAVQSR